MPHSHVSLVPVTLLLLAGCSAPSFDSATEGRKLLARDAEWAQAAAAGKDVDKIVAYWADDAVVMEPGQPVYQGKAAIRSYVVSSLQTPGFSIHWESSNPVFSPDGQMAYMPGADTMTVPGPNGTTVTVHMRGVSIWRRGRDGVWYCIVDIANEAPPAQ